MPSRATTGGGIFSASQAPLTEQHFARWLGLWRASLHALFIGATADLA